MVRHCPRCELRFVTDGELREHLTLDHGVSSPAFERGRYPEGPGAQRPLYRDLTEPATDRPRRYLVVANQTLGGQTLTERIEACMAAGPAAFYVVVPATPSAESVAESPAAGPEDRGATGTPGERTATQAGWRLRRALERLEGFGAEAQGEVGPADPLVAVQQALSRVGVDEVIVSTLPSHLSRWLGMDLPGAIARRFRLPVTTVVASESTTGA